MKTKYVPDLTKQMALCEANYARLLKLLPDIESCDQREFTVDMSGQQFLVLMKIQQRFKFTTTMVVSQTPCSKQTTEHIHELMTMQLNVRLYHDAKMAEVTSQFGKQLSSKYPYPNKTMHQVDEKIQLNEYLAQWLGHCLHHGYQSDEISGDPLTQFSEYDHE